MFVGVLVVHVCVCAHVGDSSLCGIIVADIQISYLQNLLCSSCLSLWPFVTVYSYLLVKYLLYSRVLTVGGFPEGTPLSIVIEAFEKQGKIEVCMFFAMYLVQKLDLHSHLL